MSRNIPLGFLAIGAGGGWLAQVAALDRINSIFVDSSNNIYVAGEETITTAAGYVAELNDIASPQWQRTLGGTTTEAFYDIAVAASGNIYTVGITQSSGTVDILLAKYDQAGALTWQRRLGTAAGTDGGYAIGLDSSENVYLAGDTRITTSNVQRPYIAKYNSSGTLQWQRTYTGFQGSGLDAGFTCIAVTAAGTIYAGGYDNTSTQLQSFAIAKMDTSGNRVWERKDNVSNTTNEVITGIAVDSSENVFACGSDSGTQEGYLYKLNSSGTGQWGRILSSSGNDLVFNKVATTSTGDIIVVGTINSGDFIAARYDTSGNLVWQRRMDTGGSISGNSVRVVGTSYTFGSSSNDYIGQLPIDGSSLGNASLGGNNFAYTASAFTAATYNVMSSFTAAAGAGTAVSATPTLSVGTATNTYSLARF